MNELKNANLKLISVGELEKGDTFLITLGHSVEYMKVLSPIKTYRCKETGLPKHTLLKVSRFRYTNSLNYHWFKAEFDLSKHNFVSYIDTQKQVLLCQ